MLSANLVLRKLSQCEFKKSASVIESKWPVRESGPIKGRCEKPNLEQRMWFFVEWNKNSGTP